MATRLTAKHPDPMSVQEAVRRLTETYSEDDPIRHKRQDTTPRALQEICDDRVAKSVRIVFYESPDKPDRRGTLEDMVHSREALMKAEATPARANESLPIFRRLLGDHPLSQADDDSLVLILDAASKVPWPG